MSQEQKASLYYREGNSDKVYLVNLTARAGGFVVEFANGRRGGTLRTGLKTPAPLPYEKAKKTFDKIVSEKLSKGYVPTEDGRAFTTGEYAERNSGFVVQLSNPVDGDVNALISSDDYVAQEKIDGERRAIDIRNGKAIGINRRGLHVDLPPGVAATYEGAFKDALIDGEIDGDIHHAFDILRLDGTDLSDRPFLDRVAVFYREGIVSLITSDHVRVVPTAIHTSEKRVLFENVQKAGGEGLVFKLADGAYKPGRPASGGDHLKFKFWQTASVSVAAVNETKRSVAIEMLDGKKWISVGNVTIPPNKPIPDGGKIIEVRYLYAMKPSNALFQPVYLGDRDDIDAEGCSIETLKYKADPSVLAVAE